MPIPLSINVYERGVGGIPTSQYVALPTLPNSYSHTITDKYGFESMSFSIPVSLEVAQDWLANGVMRSVVVTGPDATICWEGFLTTISATIAQKRASASLERMANRVRCKYSTVYDTPGTTDTASNTTSQALYGIKDLSVPLDKTDTDDAKAKRDRVLKEKAFPRSADASEAKTGAQGDVTLELQFSGWYATLEWLFYSNSSTSKSSATTQVGTMLSTIAATNAFLSTSTLDIAALGRTVSGYAEPETTYRQGIEKLLGYGDTSGYPLTWGVYDDRVFRVAQWAGATPGAVTYYEVAGDSFVYTANGLRVAPWDVRPNAMSVVRNLVDVAPAAGAVDAAARKYVGRVVCSIDGESVGVSLEPTETSDLGGQIAQLL